MSGNLSGVAFQEFDVEAYRADLRGLSDGELMEKGKTLASLCWDFGHPTTNPVWPLKLEAARAEWRRRHGTTLHHPDV